MTGQKHHLLSGVFDSEVRELEGVLDTLQGGVGEARDWVSSCTHLGEAFVAMQEKLVGYEQRLKQSEEEFNDIKMQSVSFQRTLPSLKKEENGMQMISFCLFVYIFDVWIKYSFGLKNISFFSVNPDIPWHNRCYF